MKRYFFLCSLILMLLAGCSKDHHLADDPFLDQLQGTWTADCGCQGDTVLLSTPYSTAFHNWGYVRNDTVYLLDPRPNGVDRNFYIRTPISLPGGGELYMQSAAPSYVCQDSLCGSPGFHRVN
jgi:hypothetical protein